MHSGPSVAYKWFSKAALHIAHCKSSTIKCKWPGRDLPFWRRCTFDAQNGSIEKPFWLELLTAHWAIVKSRRSPNYTAAAAAAAAVLSGELQFPETWIVSRNGGPLSFQSCSLARVERKLIFLLSVINENALRQDFHSISWLSWLQDDEIFSAYGWNLTQFLQL